MSDMPELRDGPPWAMEEMILAEPALVAPILASPGAVEAAESIREGGPVVRRRLRHERARVDGRCGAPRRPLARRVRGPARPAAGGVCIAVSHEAGTAATLAALKAADANGARTILVTAKPELAAADIVIGTPLVDTSWCHTVGYVSPLLALTAIAGAADAETCFRVIDETLAQRDRSPSRPHACRRDRLIVIGSGVDEITARELALKIEEGTHVPVTPLGIEKVLHGHLPAADHRTGIVVIRAHPGEQRDKRADDVLAAAAVLGMPTVTIDGLPEGHPLLAGAIALQLLTLELVPRARHQPRPDPPRGGAPTRPPRPPPPRECRRSADGVAVVGHRGLPRGPREPHLRGGARRVRRAGDRPVALGVVLLVHRVRRRRLPPARWPACSDRRHLSFYRALALGTMSIVAPIVATCAIVPVAAGVLLDGERPARCNGSASSRRSPGSCSRSLEPGGPPRTPATHFSSPCSRRS